MKNNENTGFTAIEVIIVVAILIILSAVPIANFILLQKRTLLDNNVQEFAEIIRLARNKTLASESNDQYGIYLNRFVSPNQYILFKGADYASRDVSSDKIYFLNDRIEFYNISLGGGSEIVFNRLTGATQESGNVSLRVKADPSQNKTIYISSSGTINFSQPAVSSDEDRIKDSRHVVFDYNRQDISTESIILTFDGTVIQPISISQYSTTGQFDWEGEVNVGGASQKIRIHTYRLNELNEPYAQFSVFRDRRYNNKSLSITISGDSSGSLAQYSADGLTVSHSSNYVENFNQQ